MHALLNSVEYSVEYIVEYSVEYSVEYIVEYSVEYIVEYNVEYIADHTLQIKYPKEEANISKVRVKNITTTIGCID